MQEYHIAEACSILSNSFLPARGGRPQSSFSHLYTGLTLPTTATGRSLYSVAWRGRCQVPGPAAPTLQLLMNARPKVGPVGRPGRPQGSWAHLEREDATATGPRCSGTASQPSAPAHRAKRGMRASGAARSSDLSK